MIEVDTPEDLRLAIGPRTAMIYAPACCSAARTCIAGTHAA
jgi:hypothetical protein